MIVAGADAWVEVAGERIAAAGAGRPPRRANVRVDGRLAPGLYDLQVNGAGGVEVGGGPGALDRIDALLLDRGVTSYLATVVSTDDETAARIAADAAERLADPASPLEGVHFEGPFISAAHPGAHRPEVLRDRYEGALPEPYRSPAARLVTLAPELPGALELIADLRARGVAVSLGHSGASADTATRAVGAGARMVTHVFNAMVPMLHRAPGLAGVALTDRRVRVGVIADGHHVDPVVLRVIRRAAGARVRLVSDASAPAGAPPGDYVLAGTAVVSDGERVVTRDGVLAGSAVLLDEAARRWSRFTGASSPRGGLRPGAPADLVVRAADGRAERVMRRGCWVR